MPWFSTFFRPNPIQQKALERLGLDSVEKILRYFPTRYDEPGSQKNIKDLIAGEEVTIYGRVLSSKTSKAFRKKIPMGEAMIEDETGKIKAIWFHQAYMAKKVEEGQLAGFRGKVAERNGALYLTNPEVIEKTNLPNSKETLFYDNNNKDYLIPIYPETKGLSSGWFYYHIKKLISLGEHEKIVDPLPSEILKKYNLPTLATALVWIHSPKNSADATAARKRFAFEEVFFLQLTRLRDKKIYQSNPSYSFQVSPSEIDKFIKRFPFKPTGAQSKAIEQILADFHKDQPMVRLLEGDVGSGKTMVAAVTALAAVQSGLEVAYLAPTEILARQHFESFIKYFEHLGVQVGLITGKECRKFPSKISPKETTHISKPTLLKWVANGEIPIVVGTHALIQKQVKFRDLAYVIIDEQHRFGVMQRAKLVRKQNDQPRQSGASPLPHLLSMTATPIPRTLALTVYGDLDLTLLDEMPTGRLPVITEIIPPDKREESYARVRAELKKGRQVYVICPRISEPDPDKERALQLKSAKAEAKRLQEKVFPEYTVDVMHSKLNPSDKEETMKQFSEGKIDILVSTSVIEVGVNVPNATVILIEGAERFGLAQLHQLRGRVLRSNHQAYCFVFSETKTAKSLARLKALVTAKNGFELA
ncbi:MAG TPA: ATP-dependent DNA helicase RecG, partial [Candidatus Paceibacterota bacterium]|nr:ATP-dependent DNA helicase RecG [Candidatus Paceibacterota bacterium]